MKIILFSYRDVGFDCLNYLININKFPDGVVIPVEDKKANFKSILKLAKKNNIKFLIYRKNKSDNKLYKFIKLINPDYGFTCYYPYIIKPQIIKLFTYKIINLHGGILPDYKGALSSMWAIINGESHSGSTIHFINEKIDQGNIIETVKCKINKYETNFNLYSKISRLSFLLFKKYINLIFKEEKIFSKKQNRKGRYFSRKLPNNGTINWLSKSGDISRFCRAFYFPGFAPAKTKFKRKHIYIKNIKLTKKISKELPGQITRVKHDGVFVATKDYDIFIDKVTLRSNKISIKDIKVKNKFY